MATSTGIARSILVGLSDDCHYRATDVRSHGLEGVSFTLVAEGTETPIRTNVPGIHTVHAFLSAAAVARELGMSWEEIQAAAELANLDARQRIVRGSDGVLIIDDSYNAAPMSVSAALELLRESPGTRIAVLGDMLELGPEEEACHREVGERAALVADWLVTRGDRSRWIADEAERRGMPPHRVQRVSDNSAAVAAVREILAHEIDGDTTGDWSVLVKGSRGMRMEEVVNGLRGEM
jgi:UDP-N-acetylmuramoyl-tripeptide--D-alanyl-D-alanine ligase